MKALEEIAHAFFALGFLIVLILGLAFALPAIARLLVELIEAGWGVTS